MPSVPSVNGEVEDRNVPVDDLDAFIDESMEGTEDEFDTGADDDSNLDGDEPAQRAGTGDRDREPEPELPLSGGQGQQPDPSNPNNFQRVGAVFADKNGNIVDRAGRILAARGEAARHWMNLSKQAGQVHNIQRQMEAMRQQSAQQQQLLAHAKQIAEMPQKYNLSEQDFREGMALMSKWSSNPVEVAREIVQRTISLGHNVSDILGKNAGDALEMGAIRQLINEATRGQRQREEQETQVSQQRANAMNAYNAFISRYPDAELHSAPIADLMNNHGLSAVEAYHEVKHFCIRNGLDFDQPLGPQIETARAQQQPQMNGRRSATPQRAPMSPGASGGRSTLTTETQFADADSDWSSILNSVLRDSQ